MPGRIMLLGPGTDYLEDRQRVNLELAELGYRNVVIMEQVMDSPSDKFSRIITGYAPQLIIAFFYKNAKMDGVTFELGWLCHMYQSSGLTRNLRLLLEMGYDWNQTTPYIPSLLPSVFWNQFDESKDYSRASIHQFVINSFFDSS